MHRSVVKQTNQTKSRSVSRHNGDESFKLTSHDATRDSAEIGYVKTKALEQYCSELKQLKLSPNYDKKVHKKGAKSKTDCDTATGVETTHQKTKRAGPALRLQLFSVSKPDKGLLSVESRLSSNQQTQSQIEPDHQQTQVTQEGASQVFTPKLEQNRLTAIAFASVNTVSMKKIQNKLKFTFPEVRFLQAKLDSVQAVLIPSPEDDDFETHKSRDSHILYFGLLKHIPIFTLSSYLAYLQRTPGHVLEETEVFSKLESRPIYSTLFNKFVFYVAEGDYPPGINRYWLEQLLFCLGCKVELDDFDSAEILLACRTGEHTEQVDPIYGFESKRIDYHWFTDSILAGKLLDNEPYMF